MSYASDDISEQESAPVLLYEFCTDGSYIRMCALPVVVTMFMHEWFPGVVAPGEFGLSSDPQKDSLDLKIDINAGISQLFLSAPPDSVTTLTVWRVNMGSPTDRLAYWCGRVASTAPDGAYVAFACESIFSTLQRPGLRVMATKMCHHVLYDQDTCMLHEADFSTTVTAYAGPSAVKIDAPALLTVIAEYIGGTLTFTASGEKRTIVSVSAMEVLELEYPIASLNAAIASSGSASVTVAKGCVRSLEACRAKGNAGNHGGFAWFPDFNPFLKPVI